MTKTQSADVDNTAGPDQLGPYRIVAEVARGGMGIVYRGERAVTGEAVAIKTVRPVHGSQLATIRREIHALRRVRHPGIVSILEDGVTDGVPWYAMPLLVGQTLREHLDAVRQGGASERIGPSRPAATTVPLADALERPPRAVARPAPSGHGPALGLLLTLIRRVCGSLAYMHGEGLVHRDLKPDNIVIEEGGRPVLVDLGIAMHFGGAGGREELDVDSIVGTPAYIPPEQLRGELVDARADLYSLGCILYECATGQPPFTGESSTAIFHQHLYEQPLLPSLRVPGIPAELDRLILQLLQKHPRDRLGFAADVAEALVALGAEPEPEEGPRPRAYLYLPELTSRADALSALDAGVSRAVRHRRGGLMLVRGESGVGKTRLAREMGRSAIQIPWVTLITGRCDTLGAGEAGTTAAVAPPLHPLRQVLLAAADRARDDRAAAERLFGARGKVLAAYEPALADLPGQEEHPAPAPLPPEEARARVIAALQETLWALSEPLPLVLVLDDLQWADELTLSLLEAFAASDLERRAILIVGTYRIEETRSELEALSRMPGVHTISLSRLDASSVASMVSGMLALRRPPRAVLGALVQHSNGNPFFVAEYLRAAIGEGMLRRDENGTWHFDAGEGAAALSSLALPHTLAELIERRLARLDAHGQALASWGAVLGQELDGDLLLSGAEDGAKAAMESIEALRMRQILEEGPMGRLRFVHDKIREIAYDRTPEAARAALHRRAGDALEARHGAAPDMARTLGHHYARAGVHDKAGLYYERAADRAREVYANGDAIRLYQMAADELMRAHAGASAPAIASLHERRGDVHALIGQQAEARDAYTASLAAPAREPLLAPARLQRKIGKTLEMHHKHADALERYALAEAALGTPPAASDEHVEGWWREWLQIQLERISVHYWLADVERMSALIESIRTEVAARGTPQQRSHFFHALTQKNLQHERFVASPETVRWARSSLAELTTVGEAAEGHWVLAARCSLAIVRMLHGSVKTAEKEMSAALHAAERTGDLEVQARALTYLTVIHRMNGRVDLAEARAKQSLALSTRAHISEYDGAALGNLAWIALRRGDDAEAERKGREALARWASIALVYPFQWLARMPLARVALSRRDLDTAMEQVSAMLDARQQRLHDAISSALDESIAAFAEGRRVKARRALERALRAARRCGYA